MLIDKYVLPVVKGEADLLKKLVRDEIDRRCVDIDETIMRAYAVVPAKHTIEAIAEVQLAILVLVHSPLADLERKLSCIEPAAAEEPAEEPEPGEEPAPAEEPEPGKKPAKAKA
ncbi:hypothetical protein ES705_34635 [subsurface metagenome]